jgi:hypothetical protein
VYVAPAALPPKEFVVLVAAAVVPATVPVDAEEPAGTPIVPLRVKVFLTKTLNPFVFNVTPGLIVKFW